MSLYKKILAKAGIGAAKVDFILPSRSLTAGEEAAGTVRLQGGITEQEIQTGEILLYAEYTSYYTDAEGQTRMKSSKALIQSYTFASETRLQPGEARDIPAALLIPLFAPLTLSREQIWFETRLHIDNAADPRDRDAVTIGPDPLMNRIFAGMERLGFIIVKSLLTENRDPKTSPDPFIQRIVYQVPYTYHSLLNEMIISPVWTPEESLRLVIEINTKSGVLKTLTGKDIVIQTLEFRTEEWSGRSDSAIAERLKAVIDHALGTA